MWLGYRGGERARQWPAAQAARGGLSAAQRDPNVPSPGSDDEAAPKKSKKTLKAKKPYRPKTGTANYAFMIVMYKCAPPVHPRPPLAAGCRAPYPAMGVRSGA